MAELGQSVDNQHTIKPHENMQQNLRIFYNPLLQEIFRLSVKCAQRSALQFTENRQVAEVLYASLSKKDLPADLQNQLMNNQSFIDEIPAAIAHHVVI